MARLTPCPSCHAHVLADDRECPHCGAGLRTTGAPRVAAVAMGLALTSCGFQAEPAYGIPDPSTSIGNESTAGPSTEGATEGVTSTSTAGTEGMTGTAGTEGMTGSSTAADGSGTAGTGDSAGSEGSSSGGPEPAYGVPGTTTG